VTPFLSSALLDLVEEREAVLFALRKKRFLARAMEDFLALPYSSARFFDLRFSASSRSMKISTGSIFGMLRPPGTPVIWLVVSKSRQFVAGSDLYQLQIYDFLLFYDLTCSGSAHRLEAPDVRKCHVLSRSLVFAPAIRSNHVRLPFICRNPQL
jgi:hypothetical protein